MRFEDIWPFRFYDDSEFEVNHPRDKDGKFSKSRGVRKIVFNKKYNVEIDNQGKVVSGLEKRFVGKPFNEVSSIIKKELKTKYERITKEWLENKNKVNTESSFDEIIESINCKASARHALKVATRKQFGEHKALFPDGEIRYVYVTAKTVDEANNKIGKKSVSQETAIEEAKRHVFALKHLDEILSGNATKEWKHDEKHNSAFEFITFYKRLKYKSKTPVFLVDVSRKYNEKEGRKFVYNITNEENSGFKEKIKHINIKDGFNYKNRYEIGVIRCSLDTNR